MQQTFSFPEYEEQNRCEVDRRLVRARRRGQDQEAGHKVPVGILGPERSGELESHDFTVVKKS